MSSRQWQTGSSAGTGPGATGLEEAAPMASSSSSWTTEQLMKNHIDRLQNAWQQTTEDLATQREVAQNWQEEAQRLLQQVQYYQLRDNIQQQKLLLSNKHQLQADNPYELLATMRDDILPKFYSSNRSIQMACLVKSADNWIALTSQTNTHEDMIFTYKPLDNFIKFRINGNSNNGNHAFVAVENVSDILPTVVVDYFLTGNLPEFTADRVVYGEERDLSKKKSNDKRMMTTNDSSSSSNYLKGIFLKSQEDVYSRCIFVLYSTDADDVFEEENAPQQLADNVLTLNRFAQQLMNGMTITSLHPDQLWKDLFHHLEQLMLASVVRMFEVRSNDTLVLHSAIKDTLVKKLLTEKSTSHPEMLKEAIRRLEQIIELEAKKREEYLQEINEDEAHLIGDMKVKCDLLFSSLDCLDGNHIPMINTDRQVLSLAIQATDDVVFATFEDAMQSAVTTAMMTGKAQLKAFSKLSSQSYHHKLSGHQHHHAAHANSRATIIEHHIYLAIPMKCHAFKTTFACTLIQITSSNEIGTDSQHLQHQLSPANGTVAIHQSLIHNLSSAMSQDVGEAIMQHIAEQNFFEISLFPSPKASSSVQYSSSSQETYSELSVIEAFKELVEKHRLSLTAMEVDEDGASTDSKSSASDTSMDHGVDHDATYGHVNQALLHMLQSDWTMVFQLTTSAHHQLQHHRHGVFEEEDNSHHYHHPEYVSLMTNVGHRKVLSWTELPHACKHDIGHILHAKNKRGKSHDQHNTSAQVTMIPLGDSNVDAQETLEVHHGFDSDFAEYLSLFELDHSLLHQIHSVYDHERVSKVHSYAAITLSSAATKSHQFKHPLRHVETVIFFGRLWRGRYQFQTSSPIYSTIQHIGRIHRKAMIMIELDHLKSEAFDSRHISSIRHETDERIERFSDNLDHLQKRIVQAKQDQHKAKQATVAEFRSLFWQSLVQFVQHIFDLNRDVIVDAVCKKHFFQLSKLQKIELIVKEGSSGSDRVQEWLLDGTLWQWSAKDMDEGESGARKGRSKSRKHKKKDKMSARDHLHQLHICTEEIQVYCEEENLHNLKAQRGASRVAMFIRFYYEGQIIPDYEGNAPPLFIEAMKCCPGEYAWLHAIKWFLTKNVDIIMHCPPTQTLEEQRQIATSKVYSNLALYSLSATMLNNTTFLARTVPQSITKPYHLHDYLHNGNMLHRLCAHHPFNDYVILPITNWNSRLNRVHLEDSSSDDQELFDEADEFVHLLHLDEDALQDAHLHFLRDQTLSLPVKLSKMIRRIHTWIENSAEQQEAVLTTEFEDSGVESDGNSSPSTSLNRKKRSVKKQINLADSWQSWSKGSVISTLPEMGKVLYNYLNDLDIQLEGKLCSLMLGNEYADFLDNQELANEVDKDSDVNLMDCLVDTDSKVLIYSPFYPNTFETNTTEEEFHQHRTLRNSWATHYLLVCRKDRLITPSSFLSVQEKLDEIFSPSQVIAAGQPWFECVSGMERLLLAATSADQHHQLAEHDLRQLQDSLQSSTSVLNSPSKRLFTSSSAHHPHSQHMNSFVDGTITIHRGRSILAECMSILKASVGSKYIASVGYLLVPNRERLLSGVQSTRLEGDDDMSSMSEFKHSDRVELLRCCSDSNTGASHRWELGPGTMTCPANSQMINARFAKRSHANKQLGGDHRFDHFQYQFQDHHVVGKRHKEKKNVHEDGQPTRSNTPQIHYIEMTSAQLNDLLLESNADASGEQSVHSRSNYLRAGAHNGLSDAIGATGILLRTDVRVLQIFITSNFNTELGSNEDLVVASLLVYVSTNGVEATNKAADIQAEEAALRKEKARSRSRSRSPYSRSRLASHNKPEPSISFLDHRPPQVDIQAALGKGLMHGIMRVIDITGSLISSLYQRKRAELLYDIKIGEDLATVQSERDYLYDAMEKLASEVLSSYDWSVEDDGDNNDGLSRHSASKDVWQMRFIENVQGDLSQATKPAVIESTVHTIYDQMHRFYSLRNHFDQLQSAHDKLVEKLNQTIVEKEHLFDYLLTFSNTVEDFCTNVGRFPTKKDKDANGQHPLLTPSHREKSSHMKIEPEKLISSLISTSTLFATLHKAVELLVECGMYAELCQFAQSAAAKLYAYTYRNHHQNNYHDKNTTSFHLICREIVAMQDWLYHMAETGSNNGSSGSGWITQKSVPEFLSTARADYSLIWCTKQVKSSATANASQTSLDLREEVHYTHGAVLVPDKMSQAILLDKVVIAEGSELVYPLPVREPYLQYFASKALVVQKVYYQPVLLHHHGRHHEDNSKYCAVIQCIVYENYTKGADNAEDYDDFLSSEGTKYLVNIATAVLRLVNRNAESVSVGNVVAQGNVQIPSSVWTMLNKNQLADKSVLIETNRNPFMSLDRSSSSITQSLLTDQYCKSVAQMTAALLHGTASCAAIDDKNDFAMILQKITQHVIRYADRHRKLNFDPHRHTHHQHHSSQHPHSQHHADSINTHLHLHPDMSIHNHPSGIHLQGKALTKLRQIMKEFYASGEKVHVACVEFDFLVPSSTGEEVCYPKWIMLTLVSMEDHESAHAMGLSQSNHESKTVHGEGIVLLVVEVERPPISNDYNIIQFIMEQYVRIPIQQYWQRICIDRQAIDLRSLAGSLAATSQTLISAQHSSTTMIQIWQLLNSINPYFYAKHHVDLTSGVGINVEEEEEASKRNELYLQLQSKYVNSFQLIQQWLKDGKELSNVVGATVRCRLMPILSHELAKVKSLVLDPTAQDSSVHNGGEWYEQKFSEGKYADRFFLPLAPASAFIANSSSFMYGNSSEGLLAVLGAIALQSYSVVIDDISSANNTMSAPSHAIVIPISREYDLLRDDEVVIKDQQDMSPDMQLRSRLSDDYFIEGSHDGNNDVRVESYCSNWVLVMECDDEIQKRELLHLLSPDNYPDDYQHQDVHSVSVEKELSQNPFDHNLPLHILSTLSMSLRQYILWHRDAIATYVFDHDSFYVNTIVDKVICHMADKAHNIEGMLIRAMDILPVEDSLFRMENVVAVLSHHLYQQETNSFSSSKQKSSSDLCKIQRAYVHWCDHSLSVPSYYHNSIWKTCQVNHHQHSLNIATDPNMLDYFSEEELNLLELSKQHHWEVVDCPLDTEDIAKCLGSEKGVALFSTSHNIESNSITILLGSVSTAIPYILHLEFQLPASAAMPSLQRTILQRSEQLLETIHKTMDQIILTLFIAQRRHLFTSVTNQKLTFTEQRQKLLSDCMALCTSEGSSPGNVLQKFQLLLSSLPGIHSSTLICRDTSVGNSSPSRGSSTAGNGRTLYEETMTYHNGQANPSQSQVKHDFDLFSPGGASTMLLSPLPSNSSRHRPLSSTHAHSQHGMMSPFPSVSRTPHMQMSALQSPAPHSFSFFKTNPEHAMDHNKTATINNGGASSTTTVHHLHNQHVAEMENVFECHEIQGKLTVVFSHGMQARPSSPLSHDHNSTPILQTPNSKGNHVKFGASNASTGSHTLAASNSVNVADMVYDLDFQQLTESLLEVITRALVRRVFELHRGGKNKKLMAMKKQELNIKSQELAEMNEQISSLAITNNMTQDELHAIATESERLRLLMSSEQKHLKESLQQKKEMNAHLRQSLVELKKESEKKDALLYKQIKELRERCVQLENDREKEKKDREKHINKEVSLTAAKSEMARQLSDLNKSHIEAEHTIRQLKAEVQALTIREASLTESGDSKVRGILQKVKLLEEELTAARGTNNFLKKQLESSNHNFKVAQEEHVRQLHALQTALISHGHPIRSRSNSPSHSPQAAARASTTTRSSNVFSSTSSTANTGELMELLAREQQRARDMQQKIHSLQEEKNTMN